jgi:hypothetical protein
MTDRPLVLPLPPNFKKIGAFLQNGTYTSAPDPSSLHVISGWAWNTLLGYNCAVKKFLLFVSANDSQFRLPITEDVLEAFCLWAGQNHYSLNEGKISSLSLKKYIIGLKAWHNFHKATFPSTGKARIDLMLKASARLDACTPTRPPKPPVMLWHLMLLMTSLFGKSEFDTAVADLCIVAFWGLARLSELT